MFTHENTKKKSFWYLFRPISGGLFEISRSVGLRPIKELISKQFSFSFLELKPDLVDHGSQ